MERVRQEACCRTGAVIVIGIATIFSPAEAADVQIRIVPSKQAELTHQSRLLGRYTLVGFDGLATLMRKLRLSSVRPAATIEIVVEDGIYRLQKPIELGPIEAPGNGYSVAIRAAVNAQPVISGSIDLTKRVRRAHSLDGGITISRIDLTTHETRGAGNLQVRGYDKGVSIFHGELFHNGRRLPLARWPNVGWLSAVGTSSRENPYVRLETSQQLPKGLQTASDLWALGYWRRDWAAIHLPVTNIELEPLAIMLSERIEVKPNRHLYLYNDRSLIDKPGEWYLDRRTGEIDIALPQGSDEPIEFSVTDTLLKLKNAAHVHIRGLTFDMARGNAVVVENGNDVVFSDCVIRNAGGSALILSGHASGIEDCEVHDVGDTAIRLMGGDRQHLSPASLFVRRNHIYEFGRWSRTYTAAVELWGVGQEVVGNRIHGGPHTAMIVRGNDHRIENNLIYDVLDETGDAGVIYQFGDWAARGTLVRGNTICRIRQPRWLGVGIYLDLLTSGWTVIENRLLDVDHGILINGGSDNVIASNLIVRGQTAIYLDPIAQTWMRRAFDDPTWYLLGPMRSVPHNTKPFDQRYPGLSIAFTGEPRIPKRNVIQNNKVVGARLGIFKGDIKNWQVIQENDVSANISNADLRKSFPEECFD